MQSELLRSLQIALQYENAVLDLTKLQEDAFMNRRDTLSALDDLRNRLVQHSSAVSAPLFSQLVPRRYSRDSPLSPGTPSALSSSSCPIGVVFPEKEEEAKHGISRLFSTRTKPKRASTSSSTISQMIVSPNLQWLGPVSPEPEEKAPEYELPAGDVQALGDIKVPVPEPDTTMLHPAMAKNTSISRHVSTSTHSSDYSTATRGSDWSEEKIPVVAEDEETTFPNAADIAAALPPSLPPQNIQHQRYASSSSTYSYWGSTIMSPTNTISTSSPLPSPTIPMQTGNYPDQPASYPSYHSRPTSDPSSYNHCNSIPRPPSSHRSSTYSSTQSQHDHSIRPNITSAATIPSPTVSTLVGRPSKANQYWGFCKGSWTIREDWRKGLHVQVLPSGMFGTESVWRCKHCTFDGPIFGDKKPYSVDPNVHKDPATGVRYTWLFLAKSHVRKKMLSSTGEGGFGCVFCVGEGRPTGIFGSEAVLFRHVFDEHRGMGDDMAAKGKCVLGRVAEESEDFDINIP